MAIIDGVIIVKFNISIFWKKLAIEIKKFDKKVTISPIILWMKLGIKLCNNPPIENNIKTGIIMLNKKLIIGLFITNINDNLL